jgi:hypothetical protein
MNLSPFSSRHVLLDDPGHPRRGHDVLLGKSRPEWFLPPIPPLLVRRIQRVSGKPLRPTLKGKAA